MRMVVSAWAAQRADLGQRRHHAPRFPKQVAMLVHQAVVAAVEADLVWQHLAQALHNLQVPPEPHMDVAQAML
eukprot:10991019-Heterocapsa_arctica.AAC.1